MIATPKHIFTIPPEEPFLERLAEGLWARAGGDPLRLGAMEVLLPTRRAALYLRAAFLRAAGGKATILPRMRALGDPDEDEFYFGGEDLDPDVPPAVAPLRRRLLLARLIAARDKEMPLDQAAQLAEALGAFLDEAQTARRDLAGLEQLAPAQYARHWQETLRFLTILTAHWPEMLKEEGGLDPAARRNLLLERQAALWRKHPPAHPVIAAGSTGSIPATADLLDVIAGLPDGAVVLPGLDTELDEEAWQKIEEAHPQFGMKELLEKFGVERRDVRDWTSSYTTPSPAKTKGFVPPEGETKPRFSLPLPQGERKARARLLQKAMRPAEATEAWRALSGKEIPRAAVDGLSCVVCENAQEEASVIAFCLRAALEQAGKTAALVTPDRDLAARVAAQLRRWHIEIDDSAGASLATLPAGGFLLAALDVARPEAGAVDVLSLLKHPIAACGLEPALCRAKAREAEVKIWRAREPDKEQGAIAAWLAQFERMFAPLRADWHKKKPLGEWLAAHLALAENLAASDTEKGAARLWREADGEAAAAFCDQLREAARDFALLSGAEYADLFAALLRAVTVRAKRGQHPRLAILGLLEARLIRPDLVILGGLNEGVWPPEAPIDPWMSRPMKREFGLPLPERRIGLAAHDFVQLAAAPEVLLTRARRMGHAPAVPSRFLSQLETVLRALGYDDALAPAMPWRQWARMLDEPARVEACRPPAPCPPLAARPNSLRVTEVGLWRRNPYAIYARHILKLEKLGPLDAEAGAAERGIIVHRALEQFLRRYPGALPPHAVQELLAIGRAVFAGYEGAVVEAFWRPRFERLAAWFVAHERERRANGIEVVQVEAKGEMILEFTPPPAKAKDLVPPKGGTKSGLSLPPPQGGRNSFVFTLRGRADRIDRLADGTLEIIDYKTGGVPKQWELEAGYEPQLPLLAAIAKAGGFEGLPAAAVAALAYWRLTDEGEIKPLKGDAADMAQAARAGLERLIAAFADSAMPYLAAPKPVAAPRYDDYAHLARYAEWGRTNGEAA
ncbi:MAG TPA: double-strand break repair protein AddB [Alphaproteobacteria bacterium]|nr:double-strand break repair protein AddB [Alphaproteobacteria bacterium]